jgi:uncharacterized protein (TIGR03435 family)
MGNVRNCSLVLALAFVTGLNSSVRAQTERGGSRAQFEVATIKPHDPDIPGFGIVLTGRRFTGVNVSVSSLMAFAYTLHPRQIVDAPGWIESERFDVVAEAAEGDGTSMKLLAQDLLTERFRLAFHRTWKELSVFELLPAKSGPKLADHPGDPNGKGTFGFHALGSMEVHDATMADFGGWMQRYILDRPVVDRTGVVGRFTFNLTWKPDEFQFTPIARALPVDPANNELPDLYTALEQQLGLKLKPAKAPVEVFAVDRLGKPTAN